MLSDVGQDEIGSDMVHAVMEALDDGSAQRVISRDDQWVENVVGKFCPS
jgi:hypothetical protein